MSEAQPMPKSLNQKQELTEKAKTLLLARCPMARVSAIEIIDHTSPPQALIKIDGTPGCLIWHENDEVAPLEFIKVEMEKRKRYLFVKFTAQFKTQSWCKLSWEENVPMGEGYPSKSLKLNFAWATVLDEYSHLNADIAQIIVIQEAVLKELLGSSAVEGE